MPTTPAQLATLQSLSRAGFLPAVAEADGSVVATWTVYTNGTPRVAKRLRVTCDGAARTA